MPCQTLALEAPSGMCRAAGGEFVDSNAQSLGVFDMRIALSAVVSDGLKLWAKADQERKVIALGVANCAIERANALAVGIHIPAA